MSENIEKCVVCHEDLEASRLNKCTTCTAHYCTCCLVSLMMNSFKKEDSVLNCCYCSKKMQIKFDNGIELPINTCHVETSTLPYFGIVQYNLNSDWCSFNEELKYLNTQIFGDDHHNFYFNDGIIRDHLNDRSQWYECHLRYIGINNFRMQMYSKHPIYYCHIDKDSKIKTQIHVANNICFDYNSEQNRWDFIREYTNISKRTSCMECNGAVARNYQFHVANSKVHKKWIEEQAKATASAQPQVTPEVVAT